MTEKLAAIYKETTASDGTVSRTQVSALPADCFIDYPDKDVLDGTGLTRINTYPLQRAYIQGTDRLVPAVNVEWEEGDDVVKESVPVNNGEARLSQADGSHLIFEVGSIIDQARITSERANRDVQPKKKGKRPVINVWTGNAIHSNGNKNKL